MELLYRDRYYDKVDWEQGKYCRELKSQLGDIDNEVDAIETDVGLGASEPSVLVELFKNIDWGSLLPAVLTGVFFLGDKINKNIDAWIEIAKKFKRILSKFPPARIDEKGALLVVLDRLGIFTGPIKEIDVSIQVIPFMQRSQGKRTLDKRPDALYVVTVLIPEKVYVVGIKSNMNVVFSNEYSTSWIKF